MGIERPAVGIGQLLECARQGENAALGQLLSRYEAYLRLLARVQIDQRVQRKVDESDLVQDVFLEATRKFAQFRGGTEAELTAWLRQILARKLLDLVRRYHDAQRRRVSLEQELEVAIDHSSAVLDRGLVNATSSPSHKAQRREEAVLLADALARLPAHYREVLILRHLESLSFDEIASRMDRTMDSVKNLWIRALAHLRVDVGEE